MSFDPSALRDQILRLKEEKRALILSHNYQRDEVQEIADFVGDSLELSRIAATRDCDMIVFCGVHFMAESASILSPEKTVLLPEQDAGCPSVFPELSLIWTSTPWTGCPTEPTTCL